MLEHTLNIYFINFYKQSDILNILYDPVVYDLEKTALTRSDSPIIRSGMIRLPMHLPGTGYGSASRFDRCRVYTRPQTSTVTKLKDPLTPLWH